MTGLGNTLSTFPNFVAYFAVGGALTALFVALYSNMTPHREIALIRAGNVAAAIALTGALVGFVIPLASVVAHSAGIIDLAVWGTVALAVQLSGFIVTRLVLPGLPHSIEAGNIASATLLAGISLSLGLLNAACMTG
jgi:putative membrane protein